MLTYLWFKEWKASCFVLSMDETQLVSWATLVSWVGLPSKRTGTFFFFWNLWSLFSKQDSEIFEHVQLLMEAKIFILLYPSVFEIYDIYSFSVKLEPLTCQNEWKDKRENSLLSLKQKPCILKAYGLNSSWKCQMHKYKMVNIIWSNMLQCYSPEAFPEKTMEV